MSTISITTTQNVVIEYELARLWDRFFAFLIDIILLFVVASILGMVSGFLVILGQGEWILIVATVPLAFYTLISELLMNGQTLGKKALGIRVVKLNGKRPTFGDYFIRWLFRFVDIWLTACSLASILILSSPRNQRLGGLTSNTSVIRSRPNLRFTLKDILKLNDLSEYEPQFPQVRQLSEDDLLLIKTVINRSNTYGNAAHRSLVVDTAQHVADVLEIQEHERPKQPVKFLRTLLRDYIVLTR